MSVDRETAEWRRREARARARGRFRDPVLNADQYRWWEKSDIYTWSEVVEVLLMRLVGYVVLPIMAGLWVIEVLR